MTERFWIVLIVAIVVVLVVFMLRRQLKNLVLKGLGMEAQVETHGPDSTAIAQESTIRKGGVSITDFKQTGSQNVLDIGRGDVSVARTKQKGTGQEINVRSDDAEREES